MENIVHCTGFRLHGAGCGCASEKDGANTSRETRTQLHDGQRTNKTGQHTDRRLSLSLSLCLFLSSLLPFI